MSIGLLIEIVMHLSRAHGERLGAVSFSRYKAFTLSFLHRHIVYRSVFAIIFTFISFADIYLLHFDMFVSNFCAMKCIFGDFLLILKEPKGF